MSETNSQTMTAVISDGDPDHSGRLPVRIVADDQFISIFPTGYGDQASADGYGCPVSIELYEGRLRLIVFADINDGDPTIIDLEGAREEDRHIENWTTSGYFRLAMDDLKGWLDENAE